MYNNFISQGIDNVKFIAVGKSQYESFNWKWTDDNSIPVVVDQSPYNIWGEWNANKWDVFILDSVGELHETFNINPWDEDRILNAINALLPTLFSLSRERLRTNRTIKERFLLQKIETDRTEWCIIYLWTPPM